MANDELQSRSQKLLKDLPPELWGEIEKRLTNTIDIQMFRSTSQTFRDRLPSPFPSIFPLKVPILTSVSGDYPCEYFYIIEHTGYLIKSDTNTNPGILVFENKPESVRPDFFAFRLFANDHRQKPRSSRRVDMKKLSIIFKTYYLHYRSTPLKKHIGENYFVQKIVLLSYFSNTNHITNINPQFAVTEPGVDLSVVVLSKDGSLALVTLNSSTGWKSIVSPSKFDDIINYGGRLWGVDTDGGAYVMNDYKSMIINQIAEPPICITEVTRESWLEGRKRVVESSGKLYMLYSFSLIKNDNVTKIMVFELNSKKGGRGMYEWVEVESIGNKAFFVGHGFSFSIVVGEELSNVIRNNSIYLNGLSFDRYTLKSKKFPFFNEMLNPGPTIGVYSLTDKTFTSISEDECPPIYCTLHY